MNDTRAATLLPNVRLGMRGLPNLTGNLVPGGLYVLVAENASARFPLIANCLDATLKDGRQCHVVVPGNAELYLQRLDSFVGVDVMRPLQREQLRVFTMQEEFSKKMFRFGADRFVEELEHFEVRENGFVLMDQADDAIGLHDVSLALEQVHILSEWLARQRVTALLVFLRLTEAHSGTLNALMDQLHGIVRLGGDEDGLRLTFDYWQSSEGTVAARHFHLLTLESNLYEATVKAPSVETVADTAAGSAAAPPEVSTPTYFYMDPDLRSLSSQLAGQWQFVDTLVGMMHATRNQRRAVVIFCYQHDTHLRQLAEAIHTLRINLGKYAQIIVQEKGASLRYQNEALLLRLGTNLVIHRDVPPARMPLMIDSVAGQVFNRDVDINFEAALASVSPTSLRGYQPPMRFAREVSTLVERAGTLNVPYALVVGMPAPGMPMLDVLQSLRLSRAGDLLSADNAHCYLFLNACQQAVVLPTLERLLGGTAVDAVLTELRFLVTRESIALELEALTHNAEVGMVIDYTSSLPSPQPAAAPAAALSAAPMAAPPPRTPAAGPAPAPSTPTSAWTAAPEAPPPPATATGLYQRPPSNQSVFGREAAPRATRAAARDLDDKQ
ncbi:MAG: BcsE family c-di-GMP-binding protein [Rhodoferax sp.]